MSVTARFRVLCICLVVIAICDIANAHNLFVMVEVALLPSYVLLAWRGTPGAVRAARLYLAGLGHVGGALLGQIAACREEVEARTGWRLDLAGVARSTARLGDEAGIDPAAAAERLAAEPATLLGVTTGKARRGLDETRALLEEAELNLERQRQLVERNLASAAELDRARALERSLAARLQHAPILAYRGDQDATLADRQRQWLLQVDVLAGLGGVDADQRPPVVGRGRGDGVDILALQQLAVVLVDVLGPDRLGNRLCPRQVDVGDGRHAATALALVGGHVVVGYREY